MSLAPAIRPRKRCEVWALLKRRGRARRGCEQMETGPVPCHPPWPPSCGHAASVTSKDPYICDRDLQCCLPRFFLPVAPLFALPRPRPFAMSGNYASVNSNEYSGLTSNRPKPSPRKKWLYIGVPAVVIVIVVAAVVGGVVGSRKSKDSSSSSSSSEVSVPST